MLSGVGLENDGSLERVDAHFGYPKILTPSGPIRALRSFAPFERTIEVGRIYHKLKSPAYAGLFSL